MRQLHPHASRGRARRGRALGVSLVEALVSLAVMSFGMLGVVGVQATLRYNAEVSKQRSEAVRIGQEEMEALRSFIQQGVDTTGVRRSFADMAPGTTSSTFAGALTTNTTFTIERTVTDSNNGFKSVRIRVEWNDRNGNRESISLASQIAALGPDSTADLLRRETVSQPDSPVLNRHVSIPIEANNLHNGLSVFKPLQDGSNAGTVAWVFNNTTGMIVGQCTVPSGSTSASLTAASLANCSSNANMHLLAGTVRFSTGAVQPSAADAENPISPARNLNIHLDLAGWRSYQCFDDAPTTGTAASGQTAVRYYCAIATNSTRTWQGTARIEPLEFVDPANSGAWHLSTDGLPGNFRLCRYTPAHSDSEWVSNEQHPRVYGYRDAARQILQTTPMGNLLEQNFLVIQSHHTCPTDNPANPANRDFVNSHTLEHLPLPP